MPHMMSIKATPQLGWESPTWIYNPGAMSDPPIFNAPATVEYGSSLYFFTHGMNDHEKDGSKVIYCGSIDSSGRSFTEGPVTTGKGDADSFAQHNAAAALYNGTLYVAYFNPAGTALVIRRAIVSKSSTKWQDAATLSVAAGDHGQPIMIQYKNCLWIFFRTTGSGTGIDTISFKAVYFRNPSPDSAQGAPPVLLIAKKGTVKTQQPAGTTTELTTSGPTAVATYHDYMYLAYCNQAGNLMLARSNGRLTAAPEILWINSPIKTTSPYSAIGAPYVHAGQTPCLTVYNSLLHIAYTDTTQRIRYITYDGHTFSPPCEVNHNPAIQEARLVTPYGISVALFNGVVNIIYLTDRAPIIPPQSHQVGLYPAAVAT